MNIQPDARILKMQEEIEREAIVMIVKEGCSHLEFAIMLIATGNVHLMCCGDIDGQIQALDYLIATYKNMRSTLRGLKKLQGD